MDYKIAAITGASSGIGEAIAKKLCGRGVKVYALARSTKRLNSIKKELSSGTQGQFLPITCDISDRKSVENAFKIIDASGDSVDLLVNNAGIGFSKKFVDYSEQQIDDVIATNLRGTINVTRTTLKNHKEHQPLQVVTVTSLAGKVGFPDLSLYSSTKFALEGLTEALRWEYSAKEVSFTILRPGITDTAFFSKAGMEVYKNGVENLKSYYSPEKVAEIFSSKLRRDRHVIVVGNDKVFLAILPFVPFSLRFKALDLINKL